MCACSMRQPDALLGRYRHDVPTQLCLPFLVFKRHLKLLRLSLEVCFLCHSVVSRIEIEETIHMPVSTSVISPVT